MIELGIYIIGFLIYCAYAQLGFTESMRSSSWYIPLGLVCSISANLMWMLLVRFLADNKAITVAAFRWDAVVILAALVVPLLFHGVKLNGLQWAGIGLILSGLTLTKLAA